MCEGSPQGCLPQGEKGQVDEGLPEEPAFEISPTTPLSSSSTNCPDDSTSSGKHITRTLWTARAWHSGTSSSPISTPPESLYVGPRTANTKSSSCKRVCLKLGCHPVIDHCSIGQLVPEAREQETSSTKPASNREAVYKDRAVALDDFASQTVQLTQRSSQWPQHRELFAQRTVLSTSSSSGLSRHVVD